MEGFNGDQWRELTSVDAFGNFKTTKVATPEYVEWLEEKVAQLRKRLRQLQNQNTQQREQAARRYRYEQDYLPYEESDRD